MASLGLTGRVLAGARAVTGGGGATTSLASLAYARTVGATSVSRAAGDAMGVAGADASATVGRGRLASATTAVNELMGDAPR